MSESALLTIVYYNKKGGCAIDKVAPKPVDRGPVKTVYVDGSTNIFKALNKVKADGINSRYVLFLNEDTSFKDDSLDKLIRLLSDVDKDIITLSAGQFMGEDREPDDYIKIKAKHKEKKLSPEKLIDLCMDSYVFKTDMIKDICFAEDIYNSGFEKFILDTLNIAKTAEYRQDIKVVYTESLDNDMKFYFVKNVEWWYLNSMSDFLIPAAASAQNDLVKTYILYMIYLKFQANKDGSYNEIIAGEDVDKFIDLTSQCLQSIDDRLIIDFDPYNVNIPKYLRIKFMEIKHGKPEIQIKEDKDHLLNLFAHDVSIFRLDEEKLNVENLNYYSEDLVIDMTFPGRVFFDNGCKLTVFIDDEEIILDESAMTLDVKYFGRWYYKSYSTKAVIPVSKLKPKTMIEFKLKYSDKHYKLKTVLKNPQARMNDAWNINYWAFGNRMIVNESKKDRFRIERYNILRVLKYEYKIIQNLKKSKKDQAFKEELIKIRTRYWLLRPYYKFKKVWIFSDKLYKGGDNGEYMFDYAMNQKDGILKYYIINDNVTDYKRLTDKYGEDPILKFHYRRQKQMVLQSHVVLATHANVFGYCGLKPPERRFFCNLFNPKIACMRHGITIQYEAGSQRRQKDNRIMVFCTSKYERDNFARPGYDYEPEMLKLTGSTRFDGLINNPKNILLIAPTWRRYLALPNKQIGNVREHNPQFIKSDYYRLYNDLINDKDLIGFLKEKGYRIQFLLHPTLSPQLPDFENKYGVEILAAAEDVSYEKLLTEANVMVTDFSGIQFDFGFMKKPIVYYHPPELPPHLPEDTFKYSEMGFGPIAAKHDELVGYVKETISKGAEITPEYEARIDDFLAYTDRHNCQRVYDELIKL